MQRIRKNARELRNNATAAERHLWRFLRGRQVEGFRFRRQVPIGGYIADFACPQAMLIVELDGGQHVERVEYDGVRTDRLRQKGYRVLRYWNHDVLLRTEDVVADIHRELTKGFTPPQPSPSLREREGAGATAGATATAKAKATVEAGAEAEKVEETLHSRREDAQAGEAGISTGSSPSLSPKAKGVRTARLRGTAARADRTPGVLRRAGRVGEGCS